MKRAEYFKKDHEIVAHIPYGRVATYGQLAYLAGFPQAPRIAGRRSALPRRAYPAIAVSTAPAAWPQIFF